MALGSIIVRLTMDTATFDTDSKRASQIASKRAKEIDAAFNKAAKAIGAALGTAVVAGATALTAATAKAIDFADKINDMSLATGSSTETLSAWAYSASQAGTDMESLNAALPKLAKNIAEAADAGSKQGKLFEALGISVKDAAGNLRGVDDILPEVADKFKSLDNDTTKTAVAMQLFGKSGGELVQFLSQGSDGLNAMAERARDLGVILDSNTAQAAGDFNDKLDDLKAVALGFGIDLAAKLLPALNDTADKLINLSKNGELASNIVSVISSGMSAGVGILNAYNRAVAEVSAGFAAMEGYAKSASLIIGNLSAVGLFNGSVLDRINGVVTGLKGIKNARDGFVKDVASIGSAPGVKVQFSTDGAIPDSMLKALSPKADASLQKRLNSLLSSGDKSGGSKRAGKSDEERAADALQRQYESLMGSMNERIALFGKEGEAAKVRYDVEHGELAKLSKEKKDELIAAAEQYDALVKQQQAEDDILHKRQKEDDAFNRMNDAILQQIDLLGKTADEQEILLNLADAGVKREEARGQQIIANTLALQGMRDAMHDQVEFMDSIREAGAEFFVDWTSGAKSFKDSALDALDSVYKRILQMIAENLMDKLFGKQGDSTGGSAGGWLASIAGALFGGARASGGEVRNDRAYLVGEQGPEMFVPRTAGTIIPAGRTAAMAGGRSVQQTVNFAVTGRIDRRTQDQIAADLGRKSSQALRRNGA